MNLLTPFAVRGVTLRNRIVVSPMCQYSSVDGFADDWHLVHLGSRAAGGAGLVFVEATAVTAQGRITPGDMGIYHDAHIEALSRIASFVDRMGSVAAIQIAHAGRKGSCLPPFQGGKRLVPPQEGAYPVVAPSAIPFNDSDPAPIALDEAGIAGIVDAFVAAAKRAVTAGFRVIELHNAHGYLLHEFLSPLSNHRTDQYGGSFENRIRLSCEVITAIRKVIPDQMPLFVRISCTDWVEGGWDLDQSIELSACQEAAWSRLDRLLQRRSGAVCQNSRGTGLPGSFRRRDPGDGRNRDGSSRQDYGAAAGRRNHHIWEG